MKTKLSNLLVLLSVFPAFLISCEGSRPRRVINAYGDAYDEYEKTGDPTMLIIMIVAGIIIGGLWLWKNSDK